MSVLVSLYEYEHHITGALDSVASSGYRPLELIVVDDASRDDSCARAHEWLAAHHGLPAALLRHRYNRGLPQTRNTALGFARGELVFILDADNELYPHGLERLVEALDADPEAAFAYGLLERFDAAGPVGFLSVGPWQPERLRSSNYIDAAAMIRGAALGAIRGYSEESVLHGFEDWDVWCEFAERGWHGVGVEEVVARYRISSRSMSSLAKLSTSDVQARLVERHPRLMTGPGAAR